MVKLSVSYELPMVLAPLMEPSILGGIVTKELQANLDRFRDLVEEAAELASPCPLADVLALGRLRWRLDLRRQPPPASSETPEASANRADRHALPGSGPDSIAVGPGRPRGRSGRPA